MKDKNGVAPALEKQRVWGEHSEHSSGYSQFEISPLESVFLHEIL